jgi:Hypoxia induced protein conserved region
VRLLNVLFLRHRAVRSRDGTTVPRIHIRAVITLLTILVVLGMLATLGTLFAGMLGLTRNSGDANRSNRLMRWRVILQAVTLALFALLLLALKS